MKNLTHDLKKLTDKFASIEIYSKNESQINFNILQYLKFKSLPEIFEKTFANTLKKYENGKLNFDISLFRYKAMDIERTFKVYFGKPRFTEKSERRRVHGSTNLLFFFNILLQFLL